MNNQQLKLIRLYNGMSQREFGAHIGVAESTIAKIESRWQSVSEVTRARVLRNFDVSDPEFITFCDRMDVRA
ncbi:helix-turn-helix domain-containing protein [Virgibacillus sp. DJP39]|uniref:helix-turn-helix domain-containing protein n=1 Tax=Virgibacillus sp. DJP39 TaxID=3409790 RepID=UPI003BB656A8